MYPNYIENRKALGYEALNDTRCGIKLMSLNFKINEILNNVNT